MIREFLFLFVLGNGFQQSVESLSMMYNLNILLQVVMC